MAALVVLAAAGVGWVQLAGRPEIAAGAPASTTASTATTSATTTVTSVVADPDPAADPAVELPTEPGADPGPDTSLPADSGTGRRVVFAIERQRIWWIDEHDEVIGTVPVSGRANTPAAGTFSVYSKTEHATGLDGSKMSKFVRFTKGPNGWAIGFHGIPTVKGVPAQTEEQLGEPLSHGCIRQGAFATDLTWEFLQVGDTVVVVA